MAVFDKGLFGPNQEAVDVGVKFRLTPASACGPLHSSDLKGHRGDGDL